MSEVELRCYHHPEREATSQCDRCGDYLCSECVRQHDELRVCAKCRKDIIKRESGMSRAKRIVLAVLIMWTLFHVVLPILFVFDLEPFKSELMRFGLVKIRFEKFEFGPGSMDSPLTSLETWSYTYNSLALILCVITPWTVFGVCHVAKLKESE